jgi:hypothetical protein
MAFSGNGNTDFEKGEKFVVMVVSGVLTACNSVFSYDNQPVFPLSLVVRIA